MKTYEARMQAIQKKARRRKIIRSCLQTSATLMCVLAVILGIMHIPYGSVHVGGAPTPGNTLATNQTNSPSYSAGLLDPYPVGSTCPTDQTEVIAVTICVDEDGKQYLILPYSEDKIRIWQDQTQYVADIDLDLLKAAEEKIGSAIAQYSESSGYYLQVEEGELFLCVELIVDLTPPDGTEGGGCGVDHEHKFFKERITK